MHPTSNNMTMNIAPLESHSSTPLGTRNRALVDMTGKKCAIGPPKKVTFQVGTGDIYKIENAAKLSKREKLKRWVSVNEFAEYKKESVVAVNELLSSGSCDIFSYRGLEMVDPDSIARRRARHKNSIAAVLKTQDKQRLNGMCKPKELKKVYKSMVMESMKEALENAYMDRVAVEDYMRSPVVMEDVLSERKSSNSRGSRGGGGRGRFFGRWSSNIPSRVSTASSTFSTSSILSSTISTCS